MKFTDHGLTDKATSGVVVLGIDPSLTNFAVTAMATDGTYATWLFQSQRKGVERLLDIEHFIEVEVLWWLDRYDFEIADVAIEDTVNLSHSASVLGELAGMVKLFFARRFGGNPGRPLKVPPTMLKKYATGKGNSRKNEIMLGIYKHWGQEFNDDNIADSYVLARIALKEGTLKEQVEVDKKLLDPKFRDENSF